MSVTTAVAVYFLIWWIALFLVLPWGIRSQHEGDGYDQGTDPGAPILSRLWIRLVATTIVSAIIFGILYVIYVYRLITLDDIAGWMGMRR